jgi:sugar phosphate isomerase/epimerase
MSTRARSEPFGYCLNTSTIKGQGLGIVQEAELAAKAGYDGIEPWVSELDAYASTGGSLKDLGKRFADLGLSVENLIGFFEWLVEDKAVRRKALKEARRNLEMARKVGCKRLAAAPMGMTNTPGLDLAQAAERYRQLLEIGEDYGVVPMVEFWGMSKSLFRLGEAVHIAIESGRRDACVLADVFHMYKGAGTHDGLKLLGPTTLGLFHMNDYPATPPRNKITDAARVYPGDGVAPLRQIFQDLNAAGYRGILSLELFNAEYWKQDALVVLRTGLEKMRTAVQNALA